MDETLIHAWINAVLKPYKDEKDARDQGRPPPILILDAYHIHQMGSVVNRIKEPVDVSINKPLKVATCTKWEMWMTTNGIVNGTAKEPSCQQVATWLVDAYTSIPTNVGRNAWMKSEYAWF